jgi:class 3 adenylate cyclase/predicted component of type VI protein secretion system
LRLGLKLVAANGSQAVTVLAGRTLVVGRSPACDVPIRDLTVSRHHGEVEAAASGLRVRDLGSTNGTFINGARITEGVASPGARVAFGKVIFQVMEERAEGTGHDDATADGSGGALVVVDQMRAQAMTEIASLLAAESATAAAGRHLRVRGDAPAERQAAASSVLLAIAKELSQQGEPARMLDKAARLLLQALLVERVDILTRGDDDEMVPRVDKVRPGGAAGSGQVPRLAARKAGIDHVAVLIDERVAAGGTDGISRAGRGTGPEGPAGPDGAAGPRAEPARPQEPAGSPLGGGPPESPAGTSPALAASGSAPAAAAPAPDPAAPPAAPAPAAPVERGDTPGSGSHPVPAGTTDSVNFAAGSTDAIRQSTGAAGGHAPHPGDGSSSGTGTAAPSSAIEVAPRPGAAPGPPAAERRGRAICAPLLGMQATVLGLLYVVAEEATLGREELEFVTAFAGVVAVTLENLSLIERARGEAVAQAAYQRQFAPFVADQIAGRDDGIRLDGARCRVALLRCELRGATDLAEEVQPEETARLLSELFSEAVEVVFEHGGTLERLTGTGLMALWGAPLSSQHDADDAVQAAIGVQRALERLNGEWSRQGRPHLEAAVGIDLGEVFAGNVGGDRRLAFAAIGKPVARAAALCAAAGAGEILVTEALVEALSNPPPIDAVDAVAAVAGEILVTDDALFNPPPIDAVAADAAGLPAAAGPAAAGEPGAGGRAYRVDWHTPPTLRQSAAVSREP